MSDPDRLKAAVERLLDNTHPYYQYRQNSADVHICPACKNEQKDSQEEWAKPFPHAPNCPWVEARQALDEA